MTVDYFYNDNHWINDRTPHGHYFDRWGATEPEDAELPISYWTKERMITYAEQIEEIPKAAIKVMKSLSLEDLRLAGLMQVQTRFTGSWTDADRMRRTKHYKLDVGSIKKWYFEK